MLETNPLTKGDNEYWTNEVIEKFPILKNHSDSKFLSLKEFLILKPQSFYNTNCYNKYFEFLLSFKDTKERNLIEILKEEDNNLDIAIKTLNEINSLNIHDNLLPEDDLELIRYIENNVHFNYLKLTEGVFSVFIKIIASHNRIIRDKPSQGLNIFNSVEELKNTEFNFLTTSYSNTIRNSIAHGGVEFKERNIIYKDKKNEIEIRTKD